MPTIRVLQAADAIGGNCIGIRTDNGERILLDAGKPLSLPKGEAATLPQFLDVNEPCLGVLVSHPHQDHHGLLDILPDLWPIYSGEATWKLIQLSATVESIATKRENDIIGKRHTSWRYGSMFSIGPFQVTPYLTDHSAFDSYSLLIEIDGKRIVYSGDFRDHGRKGGLTHKFIEKPPENIDVLILEGTNLSSASSAIKDGRGEFNLERDFIDLFKKTHGRVFVSWASTNIDRLITLFRACKQSERTLVVDLYTIDRTSPSSRLRSHSPAGMEQSSDNRCSNSSNNESCGAVGISESYRRTKIHA